METRGPTAMSGGLPVGGRERQGPPPPPATFSVRFLCPGSHSTEADGMSTLQRAGGRGRDENWVRQCDTCSKDRELHTRPGKTRRASAEVELEASVEDGEAGLLGDWQAVQRACREAEVAGGGVSVRSGCHVCVPARG